MVQLRTYFLIKLITLWNMIRAWKPHKWCDRIRYLFSTEAWILLPGHTLPLALSSVPSSKRYTLEAFPVKWLYQSPFLLRMGETNRTSYRLSWLSVKLVITDRAHDSAESREYDMDPFLEGLIVETSTTFPTLHDLYLLWCASTSTWSSSDVHVQFHIINHLGEDLSLRMDEPHHFVARGSMLDLGKIEDSGRI